MAESYDVLLSVIGERPGLSGAGVIRRAHERTGININTLRTALYRLLNTHKKVVKAEGKGYRLAPPQNGTGETPDASPAPEINVKKEAHHHEAPMTLSAAPHRV